MKTLEVSEKEYEAVCRLPAGRRAEYLVKKVCDFEMIWGLQEEGRWKLFLEEHGARFPVWPARRYAAGAGREPVGFSVRLFLREYVMVLKEEGLMVAVFPVEGVQTVVMSPEDFASRLRRELREAYGEE